MRAGKLDRSVTIQRATETVSDAGTVTTTWTDIATVRAELVTSQRVESNADFGEEDRNEVALRMRYLSVITYDRLVLADVAFNITAIKEIGRRRGLELTCERVAS